MNWQESEDPFFSKVWQVTKNYTKRARTLSTCCGNDGEVGCWLRFDDSSSESDEGKTQEIKDKMVALHELYKNEEEQLQTLQSIASSTHPELFVEYPLLKRMSQGI